MNIENINIESLKLFDRLVVIDINLDKVISFSTLNGIKEESTSTYQDYFEALKKVIHPDYINSYFEAISLNNLVEGEVKQVSYSKLSESLSYNQYFDYIKLLANNVVLVASVKNTENKKILTSNNDDVDVVQLIINIENAINTIKTDDIKVNSTIKYINDITKDVLKESNKLENDYKNKVGINISKRRESLLIVDDDNLTRSIFKKVFEGNYNIIEAQNGEEAVEIFEKNIINPQIDNSDSIVGVFLDLKMPIMDGFGVLDYLSDKKIINRIPVIIISADDAKETKELVYNYDIADMIEKPFNFDVIKKRVFNMTRMYVKSNSLNDVIHEQNKDIKTIVKSYVKGYLVNYEDINNKISKYLEILLNKYNEVNNKSLDINKIISASKYYDIGLDFIPRKYLSNMTLISEEERKIVYNYPVNGSNIIKYILDGETESFIKYATDISLMHNERFDGKGFPYGLKENKIPDYVYLFNIALELAASKESISNTINNINSKKSAKYSGEIIDLLNTINFE